eukprot:s79_g26.t1
MSFQPPNGPKVKSKSGSYRAQIWSSGQNNNMMVMVTTPQIPQWLAESLELRRAWDEWKPATSPSPDEEQLLSAPADSIAATAASKTKAPTSRPPELVTDGKRAANVARLGGRRIPVR